MLVLSRVVQSGTLNRSPDARLDEAVHFFSVLVPHVRLWWVLCFLYWRQLAVQAVVCVVRAGCCVVRAGSCVVREFF